MKMTTDRLRLLVSRVTEHVYCLTCSVAKTDLVNFHPDNMLGIRDVIVDSLAEIYLVSDPEDETGVTQKAIEFYKTLLSQLIKAKINGTCVWTSGNRSAIRKEVYSLLFTVKTTDHNKYAATTAV